MTILTIISVTFEDAPGLSKTLRSIGPAPSSDVSVIVVDGSPVPMPSVEDAFKHQVSFKWIRQPDRGIYDAMNKGIRAADSDYIWFLNGGDESLIDDWPALIERLVKARQGGVDLLFFGYEIDVGWRSVSRKSRGPGYIWHGLPTSHQAILYKKSSLPAEGYPLSYRMAGDYALTAQMLRDGASVSVETSKIAHFDMLGFSSTHAKLIAHEARLVQETILLMPRWRIVESSFRHFRSRFARALIRHVPR